MKNFFNIFKKEVKELLTKQLLLGLVFMVVMFGIMGHFIGGIEEEEAKPINLAVLDLDKSSYSENILETLSKQENLIMERITEADTQKAIVQAKEKGNKVLLVIPENLEKNIKEMKRTDLEIYSIIEAIGIKGMKAFSGSALNLGINSVSKGISTGFIKEAFPDKNPESIINPLNINEFVVVKDKINPGSPAIIAGLIISQSIMIPVILMMLILYAGGTVMTSMASEKENKTLETLLTLPVKRISIIIGKMSGAAVVALMMAAVFLGGFRYYTSSVVPSALDGGTILENLGLTMTPLSYILLGVSLFLAILIALAGCMILGMFAQDTKSAQTLNMPIVLLVMIPYFLLMFQDIGTLSLPMKMFVYAIPFAHPIIASKALLFGDYSMVLGGIVYMVIFAVVIMYLAVKLFNTDKILTAKFSIRIFKRQKNLN